MKTLVLVAVLTVGALLVDTAPAQAQSPYPFSSTYYGYGASGPYVEYHNFIRFPDSGFTVGQLRGFSLYGGYYSGVFRGVATPFAESALPFVRSPFLPQYFPGTLTYVPLFQSPTGYSGGSTGGYTGGYMYPATMYSPYYYGYR